MKVVIDSRYCLLASALFCVTLFFWLVAQAATTSTLLPIGEGSNLQFTPSTGTTHYTLVDESVCNGTTDYNRSTTVGQRDSYVTDLSSIPNGATITQIEIKPCASRNNGGGGSSTMNVFYKLNSATSSDAGAYTLTGTTPVELATTSFSSLSVDKVSTSTLQIGAVYSSGNRGVRLSRIATVVTYTPLSAPTDLTGSATTTSAIGLTWTDTSSNEDGFAIERSTDAILWNGIATTTSNKTSYYNSGLAAGTTYYHRVRAFNGGVYSPYTNVATTTTISPPNAPSDLSASASTTALRITLAWTDNSSDETSFKVERKVGAGSFTLRATLAADTTTYDDTSLSAGTVYEYRVSAFSTSGGTSTPSNTTSTTAATVPNTPTGLSANAVGTTVTLDWTDASNNEIVFSIQRKIGFGTFSHIATTSANSVLYEDTGLATSTTYVYRMRAWNSVGFSAFSNHATTTTP